MLIFLLRHFKSSRPEFLCKNRVLSSFAKFTGKIRYKKQKPLVVTYRDYKNFSNESFWSELLSAKERCNNISFADFGRVLTREISSRDETLPGMKSSLFIVKCLLRFTRFCRDEIWSRDELISVKKAGMKFHPGMKKRQKRRVNTSSLNEILKWACFFFIFDVCNQICFPKLTCLNIMRVYKCYET